MCQGALGASRYPFGLDALMGVPAMAKLVWIRLIGRSVRSTRQFKQSLGDVGAAVPYLAPGCFACTVTDPRLY